MATENLFFTIKEYKKYLKFIAGKINTIQQINYRGVFWLLTEYSKRY
jgi:hypothetical protein